jgi:SnoaL-like protein
MEAAPELRDLVLRYYVASAQGDSTFLDALIDRDPGALVVGTDPSEWWVGGPAIAATWAGAWRARGGLPVAGGDPQAFREGSVGWVADQAAFTLPGGRAVPFRLTAVFHQAGGRWTLVQAHFSFGVPDAQVADLLGQPPEQPR